MLAKSNEKRYFLRAFHRRPMTIYDRYVQGLAEAGRSHFGTDEAQRALARSLPAVRAGLRRLMERGELATPAQGFYVIVPPEYRRLGCLPAEQFVPQLMASSGLEYYAGLLSAAQYHGAAHQRPQQFQVMVEKNRRMIRCGSVEVAFIARAALAQVPRTRINTPRGFLELSSVEATAVDLVGYPRHVGGLDGAATVLAELGQSIDPTALVVAAKTAPLAWAQRLGYLLELLGHSASVEPLAQYVEEHAELYTPLAADMPVERRDHRSTRWRVLLNTEVEADD